MEWSKLSWKHLFSFLTKWQLWCIASSQRANWFLCMCHGTHLERTDPCKEVVLAREHLGMISPCLQCVSCCLTHSKHPGSQMHILVYQTMSIFWHQRGFCTGVAYRPTSGNVPFYPINEQWLSKKKNLPSLIFLVPGKHLLDPLGNGVMRLSHKYIQIGFLKDSSSCCGHTHIFLKYKQPNWAWTLFLFLRRFIVQP